MPEPKPIGAVAFRKAIEERGKVEAAKLINPTCAGEEQANALILLYVQNLLAAKQFAAAGIILWGEKVFNVRPALVQKVWRAIGANQKIVVIGGSSLGKTYPGACWLGLRWLADPMGTTIKLISTTGKHTETNIFATLKSLMANTVVPVVGKASADDIRFDEENKRAAISIVRIRQGEDNSEVLQGFHPLPRPDGKAHPVYGDMTSVFAALDEAEGIPGGVWTGAANMVGSGDADHVKIMAFLNPKDITARPAQIAEPREGWGEFDVESGVRGKDEWVSREGWYVVRLDAKKSENIQQRKLVFPGFQTYEGFRGYEQKDGGNSQHYYVFARGCYPPDSALNTVTPQRVVTAMRGEFVFSGKTTRWGAADTAIDGRDDAVFTAGRVGKARAFKRARIGSDGTVGYELTTYRQERDALQVDQQFNLMKGSTEIVAGDIKKHCLRLQIAAGNFGLDATGNGEPVYILLKAPEYMGPQVRGIRFGDPATSLKILNEDVQTAEEQFDGLCSEVLFAIARWGEFGYLGIAPGLGELERQLIGRQYKLGAGQTLKVEDKKDYKKRLGRSPDNAESLSVLLHIIRTGGQVERAAMIARPRQEVFDDADTESVEWLPDAHDNGV